MRTLQKERPGSANGPGGSPTAPGRVTDRNGSQEWSSNVVDHGRTEIRHPGTGALLALGPPVYQVNQPPPQNGTRPATQPRHRPPSPRAQDIGYDPYGRNAPQGSSSRAYSGDNPPPTDYALLKNQLSSLRALIWYHVSTFYETPAVDSKALAQHLNRESLADLTQGMLRPAKWIEYLANPINRASTLRYIITYAVLKRLETDGALSKTLLPRSNLGSYQRMVQQNGGPQADESLLSKWRVLTAHLQHSFYVNSAFSTGDDRLRNIDKLAEVFDGVLGPLGIESKNTARRADLVEIIKRAAMFGNELMSLPSAWTFDWKCPRDETTPGALVLFPSLLQLSDETGRRLKIPMEIGKKEIGVAS